MLREYIYVAYLYRYVMLVGSQNLLQQSQNKRTSLLDILTSKNDHRENEKYVRNCIRDDHVTWGDIGTYKMRRRRRRRRNQKRP